MLITQDDITQGIKIAGLVVLVASAVASSTPSKTDNKVVNIISKIVDFLALNWGHAKRPRK